MKLKGGSRGGDDSDITSTLPPFSVPPPPWHLTGAAVLLPRGWSTLLALVHYASSPVGPYDELAVSTLTRRGPSVVKMYVTSQASVIGGRKGWGFPKQLGWLRWQRQGRRVAFRAGSREWRVRACGPALPVRARLWSVQVLEGQPVKVPLSISGRMQLAFQGRRIALLIESFEMTVLPPLAIN